jgi:Tol biopolymer transport system component
LGTSMKISDAVAIAITAVALITNVQAQVDSNARQLTIFDRQGNVVRTVGERGIYVQPVFSPDGTRLAVAKVDPQTQNQDIWVFDLSTGKGTRLTSDPAPDIGPIWSPDGSQIAFVSTREGIPALYRKASNGTGSDELLYRRHTAFGGLVLTDWSIDERFLIFNNPINISGALYALPLNGEAGDRKPILVSRSNFFGGRTSPEQKFLAYPSAHSGRNEIYVRPLEPFGGAKAGPSDRPWQVSKQGGVGAMSWRQDGKELFYLAPDRGIMAVEVTTAPRFHAEAPQFLFLAPDTTFALGRPGALALVNVSPDGQRFVFAVPSSPPSRQLTVFDRQGSIVNVSVEPGFYGQPALSPDGTRVAVVHSDLETGNQDIWTVDLATGKSTPVTSDPAPDSAPMWSPDGKQIAYVSTRGDYTSVYRKASNGNGSEELLYKNEPGAGGLVLTDWSADGRFLSFYSADVLCLLPLTRGGKPIETIRTEFSVIGGRFSPDGRLLAYMSDESGRYEVYVRPLDYGAGTPSLAAKSWQVSNQGAQGMIFWRQDGKELGYLAADGVVMTVEVTTAPTFQTGTPKILFRPPNAGGGGPYAAIGNLPQLKNVSRNAQRFVFAVPIAVAVPKR